MNEQVIPAEAVEAAAKALAKADLRGGFSKDDYADALIALEAAAPYIRAQAWEAGYLVAKEAIRQLDPINPYMLNTEVEK